MFWPLLLYVRARACARAARPAEGLGFIDQAIELAGGAETLPPLLYAMKGEVLLALPGADPAEAEECFQRAYDGAPQVGARMAQLRAAVGLCRARAGRGGGEVTADPAAHSSIVAARAPCPPLVDVHRRRACLALVTARRGGCPEARR